MTVDGIRETLASIGIVTDGDVELLAERTRDREVPVYRDRTSGVIFIDGHYVGDEEYESGSYRGPDSISLVDIRDRDRRLEAHQWLFVGRRVVDFGCGRGLFLAEAAKRASEVMGVELQASYRQGLNDQGIPCVRDLAEVPDGVDAIFMFHVLEHLPQPIEVLREARSKLARGGAIVIEVPHARDFMLDFLNVEAFRDFTLWSQHLVLHTRESLGRMIRFAGYQRVSIVGVQRYGLGNHLHWLRRGSPSGHGSAFAAIETDELTRAYSTALAKADMTDTLVAIAYAD